MNANHEPWRRIEERAGELALLHGGKPTPQDWAHATRELLELAPLAGTTDIMNCIRKPPDRQQSTTALVAKTEASSGTI